MMLLDNGCQVNTVTPEFVEADTLSVGLVSNLVKGKMSMVGLGRICTHPLSYIIIRVQVGGVGGYKEDQIALVILDVSKFASRVPVNLGTLTIRMVINVIKESDLDALVTPWVNAKGTYLLSGHRVNTSLIDEKVTNQPMNLTDLNEIVKTKKREKIKAFSSKVIHAQTMTVFLGCNQHVMMHKLRYMALQSITHIQMMTGSKSIVLVVRNLTAPPITLKRNAPVARVLAANAVTNAQIQTGMIEQLDAAQGIQTGRPKMTVEEWREALFEQLDLSSLDSWTPDLH